MVEKNIDKGDDLKGTEDLIESQKKMFSELKVTMEEQQEVHMYINYFVLGMFLVVVMYFFVA